MITGPLSSAELALMDAWWRAANYLSIGQIYLLDNPLLREPLELRHIKPRLLGHWGTTPGQNFLYVHLNRVIKSRDLNMIYVAGPGHGGPGIVANAWLDGTYSEIYPHISRNATGMQRLFKQFSFPGGISTTPRPKRQARFMRVVSSVTRSRMPMARLSTILISSLLASSATERRKPGRWRRPGTPTNSSTRRPMARCCRFASERIQDCQPDRSGARRARRTQRSLRRLRSQASSDRG